MFDGEYLDGNRHGKGKEYNYLDGILEFEGEYYKGYKKEGKEYIKGILIYEGIYLLDQKWEGKGYDKDGNIIYELKNGEGFIKEFDDKLNLEYEGEYKDGKRNGKGKYYDNGILRFEGEYKNGICRNGIAKIKINRTLEYEG